MSLTVAQIAKAAFDAVGGAITDAVHSAVITAPVEAVGAAYYTGEGETGIAAALPTGTARVVVDTSTPPNRVFPDFVAGPGVQVVMIEGATLAPRENGEIIFAGKSFAILRLQDLAGAGTTWTALVQQIPMGAEIP